MGAEIECVQEKNKRHQETIVALMKRDSSSGRTSSSIPASRFGSISGKPSHHARSVPGCSGDDGSSEESSEIITDDQSGYMSMASLGARAQGELLQLRSALKRTSSARELQ